MSSRSTPPLPTACSARRGGPTSTNRPSRRACDHRSRSGLVEVPTEQRRVAPADRRSSAVIRSLRVPDTGRVDRMCAGPRRGCHGRNAHRAVRQAGIRPPGPASAGSAAGFAPAARTDAGRHPHRRAEIVGVPRRPGDAPPLVASVRSATSPAVRLGTIEPSRAQG